MAIGICDAQLVVDSLAGFQMHWLNSDRDRRGHWTLDSHVTGRGLIDSAVVDWRVMMSSYIKNV